MLLLYKPIITEVFTLIMELLILLVAGIYQVTVLGFRVFLILADGQIINSSEYSVLVENMYAVIGVAMLFIIAFSLLKTMVNGEEKQGATAIKKMVTNLITSVMLIALLPTIFGFAFDFQHAVLDHGTLGLFFGYGQYGEDVNDDAVDRVKQGANLIVNTTWLAFMDVSEDYVEWIEDKSESAYDDNCKMPIDSQFVLEACRKSTYSRWDYISPFKKGHEGTKFYDTIEDVNEHGNFFKYSIYADRIVEGDIDFRWFFSLIAGLFLGYVSVIYCFDMGKRMIKLMFFQIIAPIPIMLRVIPDGKASKSFNEWGKITITCYIEVFIRVFVLYATIFMCTKVMNSTFTNHYLWKFGFLEAVFARTFILLGLILFMKDAPKLLSQILGVDSSNLKFSIMDRLKDSGVLTAASAIAGGTSGFVKNAVNAKQNNMGFWKGARSAIAGGVSGAVRSGKAGLNAKSFADVKTSASKGAAETVRARDERVSRNARYKAKGLNWYTGRVEDAKSSIKDWAGVDGGLSSLKEQKSNYDQIMGYMSQLKKLAEGEAYVQAYAGQLKALSESGVKRDDFYSFDEKTGDKVFDSAAYSKALADHAEAYEAAEKRYKLAIARAIHDNREKGNYKEIMEKFNTYRADHLDDKVIANMGIINSETIAEQWKKLGGKDADGNAIDVLKLDDKAISNLWKDMKEKPGLFDWAYNDNEAKKASGEVATKIAQKEAEERKKDN